MQLLACLKACPDTDLMRFTCARDSGILKIQGFSTSTDTRDPRIAPESVGSEMRLFEMGQFAKCLKASIDLFARKILQSLGAEALHGKRTHDSTIKQGSF
jgi:hypothetical protein